MSKKVPTESKIRLVIPAKSEYVGLARLTIGGLVRNISDDEEVVEDIKLAISEVYNNIMLQTKAVEQSTVNLVINIYNDEICIDISCSGRDLELTALTPIVWSEPRDRGYGLSLITALIDKVELTQGPLNKTTLRLRKSLIV